MHIQWYYIYIEIRECSSDLRRYHDSFNATDLFRMAKDSNLTNCLMIVAIFLLSHFKKTSLAINLGTKVSD